MINNIRENRVKQIDILRISAALLVLTYHVWVYSGYPKIGYYNIIAYGGEIGVTLFFIISGFSIYLSIEKVIEKNTSFSYKDFIIKRFIRIAPAYYICIFILIMFSNNGYLNSPNSMKDILLHILFLHNISPATHGSINGVFWTLANIVQFYLIAIILYRTIKKYKIGAIALSIIITIGYKILVYNHLYGQEVDGILYFIFGRQLIGTLDNFTIGMFIAHLYKEKNNIFTKMKKNEWLMFLGISLILYVIIEQLNRKPLYSNTLLGYTWHSIIACILGLMIYYILKIPIKNGKITRGFLELSKLEYPIYLWHLPILIQISQLNKINGLSSVIKFSVILGLTLLITLIWGYIYNETICIKFSELYNKICKRISSNLLISKSALKIDNK